MKNYREAFRSPQVIILALQYFCWSIGVYGFVLWLPSIIKQAANVDIVQAGWLSSVPYLAAVLGMVGVSWASDRLQKRKRFVWPPLLIAAVAFYGSYALGSEHFGCRTRCWWSPAPACTPLMARSSRSCPRFCRPTSQAVPWR